jgi:shikimate dehydrogenase
MLQTCTIQDTLENQLPPRAWETAWLAGIVGENPSTYAKSPSIWKPALSRLGIDAVYCPFDVAPRNLSLFVDAVRQDDRIKGFSVTMPYKVRLLPYLSELDEKAKAIGAVNVVVRRPDGALIGANTDGSGFLSSLTSVLPGQQEPFLDGLEGLSVVLIGAGGAGKAVAWYLADAVGLGKLCLATRDRKTGSRLCEALSSVNPGVSWIDESWLDKVVPSADLVVNATVKGQSGIRTLADGRVTCLEPYSALAPAAPASLPAASAADLRSFHLAWHQASCSDVLLNGERSARLLAAVPERVRFVDLIYAPLETAMLRQARLSGHRTLNGKGMNICQAADALFHWIFRDWFEANGRADDAMYRSILGLMAEVW